MPVIYLYEQFNKLSKHAKKEYLELWFLRDCRALCLPTPERQYRFHTHRKWAFDFAWPEHRLAVEIDGGVYGVRYKDGTKQPGRHTTGAGFTNDCEKLNEATLLGWRVLRFTRDHLKSGYAVSVTVRALALNDPLRL